MACGRLAAYRRAITGSGHRDRSGPARHWSQRHDHRISYADGRDQPDFGFRVRFAHIQRGAYSCAIDIGQSTHDCCNDHVVGIMIAPAPRTLSFCAFLLAALLSSLLAGSALAQDEQIQIQSRADYIYGQSMNFHLLAANLGEVETATLFIRLGTSPDSFAVEVPVEVGDRVEISYELDLTQTRLPPFGSITYWWDLDRVGDSTIRVPEQVISYVDDQFSWRQLVTTDEQGGGSIRIHWTGDSESLGGMARDLTFEMLPEIGHLVPITQILPFDIYIYPSSSDLSSALRLAGRDYQPGETYPDLGVLLLTVVNTETAESELRSGLSVGLTDLLLYQSINQSAYNVPLWLRYGIAGVARGRRDAVAEDLLISAIVADSTIPISELCLSLIHI